MAGKFADRWRARLKGFEVGPGARSTRRPAAPVSRETGPGAPTPTADQPASEPSPSTATPSAKPAPAAQQSPLSTDTSASPSVPEASLPRPRRSSPGDDATPLARAVEHQLLVREGRRFREPPARPADTRVMVVANQKGGVGKTTTTVNLGVALAQLGMRVLVIDLDPQGNASTALATGRRRGTTSSYDVVVDEVPLAEAVQAHPDVPNLWVVPATIDLAGAEVELVTSERRETRLRTALEGHGWVGGGGEDRFDYVFVDCPPSLGLLTLNALVAGQEMLIPIQAEYYALEGLGQLLETIEMVTAHLNPALEVSTIVLTMFDSRTNLAAGVAGEVREHFGATVLDTVIPRSVRMSEAPSFGQSVMTYDPASPGALSYLEAARELGNRAVTGVPAGQPPAELVTSAGKDL